MKRLGGVAGLGVAWGVAWAAVFAGLVAVIGAVAPGQVDAGEGPRDVWPLGALIGVVSGVAFGALLWLAERGRPAVAVPLGRGALWGALAAALFPLLAQKPDQVLVLCPIGAVLAVLSLAAARMTAN
jgi:hypothetical protein